VLTGKIQKKQVIKKENKIGKKPGKPVAIKEACPAGKKNNT
jgi:hypothetical protein